MEIKKNPTKQEQVPMTLIGVKYQFNEERQEVEKEIEIIDCGATAKTIFGNFKLAQKSKMLRDELEMPRLDKNGLSGYVYIEYKEEKDKERVLQIMNNSILEYQFNLKILLDKVKKCRLL